ncbi:hypothetical protein VPHD148_0329 [Vibrio phage D148]
MTDIKRGRKPISVDLRKLRELIDLGVPKTKIAAHLGVSRQTLYRILDES